MSSKETETMAENISRWDPFRDVVTLREAMDHLFDDSFVNQRRGQRDISRDALSGSVAGNQQIFTESVRWFIVIICHLYPP
jgi:hypothetical protein